MSVKLVLDNTLEYKNIDRFTSLDSKCYLDLSTPDNYYSKYEHSERLLERITSENNDKNIYRTQNNFINAFLDAYNHHKTLVIRPDDIKLQILTIISICVNNNSEKFRSYFVDHEGKKDLIVKSAEFNPDYFCNKFAELLEENIKDKDFAKHYQTKFTTTNQIISTVNNITLMNTLKEYFSFTMICECGIPSVVLEGTDDDWIKLNETYQYMKSIFIDTELRPWFRHFDKIMDLFLQMRKGESIEYIKEMWKRVISYIPQGSGGDKILGGWVRLFVPYNGSNKIINNLDKDIPCFDLTKREPVNDRNYYKWQDMMTEFYFGGDWGEMFSSFITTPATLIYLDHSKEYKVEFYSGFFQPHLSENDEICFNVGYIIREDQLIKKDNLRKYYESLGVKKSDNFSLEVPKSLQKKISEILDVFGSCCCNYVGVDPEEEERKEYYIKEGVQKIKTVHSYKYKIPSKFKDDTEKIEEIKKLFKIYHLDFY